MVKGKTTLDGAEPLRSPGGNPDPGGSLRGFSSEGPTILAYRRSKSLASAAVAFQESQNPYAKFSADTDSLDDGIHMDVLMGPLNQDHLDGQPPVLDDMPSEDIVLAEFTDYTDATSPLSEPEEIAMRHTTLAEKWRLIHNQRQRSPIFPERHYIENLKNQGTRRRRFSIGRGGGRGTLSPLTYLLRKLKLDLKMSPTDFVKNFVNEPSNGIQLLMKTLRDAQLDQKTSQGAKKRSEELTSALMDESDCLLCLKFATRVKEGVRRLYEQENYIDLLAISTLSGLAKCRATALQILSIICDSTSAGLYRVMDSLTRQRRHLTDPVLFKTLISKFSVEEKASDVFVAAAVKFFNTLSRCMSDVNARVHLQHELHMAGFTPDRLARLAYGDSSGEEELSRELQIWRQNYVKASEMGQNIASMETRTRELREEVDRLQNTVKELEKSFQTQQRKLKRTEEKSEEYRERAAELQDTVEKLSRLYEDRTGQEIDPGVNVDEVLKPLDQPTEMTALKYATIRSASSLLDIPEAPPIPPPAPPMFLSQTVRKKVHANVDLPFLNWTPIHSVKHTLFQDIDDEAVYREIDFVDFESRFKLPERKETPNTRDRRERASRIMQGKSDKILFVELNRSKNMSITKHRTGLSSVQIRDAIGSCDSDILPGEYAELLIKFIPTNDELKLLSQHANDYHKMGEAEQLLFQLARIEHLESKLKILAFLGIFEELVSTVKPNIHHVLEASNSILSSHRLRKLFEIILAFGNYMNSSRRGYTYGFRLESLYKLADVKSGDKQTRLLNYLVELIEHNYPDILYFYEDFNLTVDKGVSYHGLQADVLALRKGVDLVKYERENQPANSSLERFYNEASATVAEIAESFKKMEDAYRDVCLMFGENFKRIEPHAFFKIFTDFEAEFKEAQRQNLRLNGPASSISSSPAQSSRLFNGSLPDTPTSLTPDYSPQNTPRESPHTARQSYFTPRQSPHTPRQSDLTPRQSPHTPRQSDLTPRQSPSNQQKQAPKILPSLHPQITPNHTSLNTPNTKKDPSKGPMAARPKGVSLTTQPGSFKRRAPSAPNHRPSPVTATVPQVTPNTDSPADRAPQSQSSSPNKRSFKRTPAPPRPQAVPAGGPSAGQPTTNHADTNGKVSPGRSDHHQQEEGRVARDRVPLKVTIPERPRTSSEPTTADVSRALATLDQIVDFEEQFGGTPAEDTYDSYL